MSTGSPTDRRRRRRQGSAGRVTAAVALALLVHAIYVGLVLLAGAFQPSGKERRAVTRPTSVAVRPLTADQWARNRGKADVRTKPQVAERPRTEKKPEEKKPEEEKPKGQVVDVAPGNDEAAPDAKYLAETNNRVQKETRARDQTSSYRNAMPQRTAPETTPGPPDRFEQSPQIAGNSGLGQDDKPLSEQGRKSAFELPDARRKNEVAVKTDPTSPGPGLPVNPQRESDELVGNSNRLRIQPGTQAEEEGSSGRVGAPGLAALMPSRAVMDKVLGAAPNDHLRELEEGEGTFLNTRQWRFAGYFTRMKQRVNAYWNASEQIFQRDPTGATFAGKDRETVLGIVLDKEGALKEVKVLQSCGLDFLDMAAVNAVRRAQPFTNPPPGLLDEDGEVKFGYSFYVQMETGGPRIQLFRQPR